MYIVYERNQREVWGVVEGDLNDYSIKDLDLYCDDEHEYRPTWLVRISDMEVVPGSTVSGHYWTLSYSWSQSGELIHKGGEEYDRIDEGKHQIIDNDTESTDTAAKKSRFVTFQGLVQQICLDFGIEYIWFDQMCINQNDHDAKVKEIQQMHLIYEHSCATLALVPELGYFGGKNSEGDDIANIDVLRDSQWSKRMWTLEEAYLANAILFVGHNVHLYTENISEYSDTPSATFIWNIRDSHRNRGWKANTALHHAKKRTTSKAHDQVFALTNIFPKLKSGITFNYNQPVHDLKMQFYTLLAKNDPNIMLFGAPTDSDTDNPIFKSLQKEAKMLPSWAGMKGIHIAKMDLELLGGNMVFVLGCKVVGECMTLMSKFVRACVEATSEDDLSYDSQDVAAPTQTSLTLKAPAADQSGFPYPDTHNLKITHVIYETDKPDGVNDVTLLSLTEDPSECIILTSYEFYVPLDDCLIHPVIEKDKDHYRFIGVSIASYALRENSAVQPLQTFLIR